MSFRRRLMMAQRSGLPYDAEVEYLQSTGGQYIELPFYIDTDTDEIEITFRNTATTNNQIIFFTGENEQNTQPTLTCYRNSQARVGYYIDPNGNQLSTDNRSKVGLVKHTLRMDYSSKIGYYDFLPFSLNIPSRVSSDKKLILLGSYNSNPYFQALLYSFKVKRNGNLVHDLQPVRKNGEGYFYDRVGGILYGNLGTGNFTIGYDKLTSLSDYTQLDYIQNTSTAATAPYIDTGINTRTGTANSTTISMSMKVMYQDISSTKRQLMGSDYGPFFGCDKGKYASAGAMTGVVPSTTSYDSVTMDTYTWDNANSPGPAPLCLFRLYMCVNREMTSTSYLNLCKLKEFKIYIDGIAVRDYVPVLHPAGVYGMFDKVENKFYASATSVGFTGGFDN